MAALAPQVLRWFGYFREAVVPDGSPEEQRVRRVVVHYYLVDNTLDVSEPRQDDSGIMQVSTSVYALYNLNPETYAPSHYKRSAWQ